MHKVLLFGLLALASCKPTPFPDERINKWEDPQLVKIYELQDRRKGPELIPFLKAKSAEHRAQAALAFASLQDSAYLPYLAQMVMTDGDASARKAAAYAIGQLRQRTATKVLLEAFAAEVSAENQEVLLESLGKCISLRGLTFLTQFKPQEAAHKRGWLRGSYQALLKRQVNPSIVQRAMELIGDPDPDVSILAAHYLFLYQRRGMEVHADRVRELIALAGPQEAKDRLALILEQDPRRQRAFDAAWIADFDALTSPYHQAKAIEQLREQDAGDLRALLSSYMQDTSFHPIAHNAVLMKMLAIERAGDYPLDFIGYELLRALRSGDMALQSIAAQALMEPDFLALQEQVDLDELKAIRDGLQLPRQVETHADLSRLIAALEGSKYHPVALPFTRPMDWPFIKEIPRDQRVILRTSKGEIVLECMVEEAPASVSNFIKLVDSGFYNDKAFHRVVPHFVIQAGCPRGDGWGSLDWAQRSEFSNYEHYTAGSVGLASSGKDTEGVQLFITPCGTPMLNGRYTLFARVVSGLDVVKAMELGDLILSADRIP